MNDWWKKCEHGGFYPHNYGPRGFVCPGGSPVTAADLEGEKVWWCQAHWCSGGPPDSGCWKADVFKANAQCRMVEGRLLIPIPASPDGAEVKTSPRLSGESSLEPQQPSGEVPDPQPATEGTL